MRTLSVTSWVGTSAGSPCHHVQPRGKAIFRWRRQGLSFKTSSLGGDAQTIPKESARHSCTLWQKQAVSAGEISSLWWWKALLTPESGAQVWFEAKGRRRECTRGRNRQGVARAFCLACVWSREGSDAGADQVIDRGFWPGTAGSVPASDRVSEAESLVDLYAPLVRTRSAAITHWCVARLSPSDRARLTSPYPPALSPRTKGRGSSPWTYTGCT
ncbi:hypothetical protein Bbelb_412570 [Branchiostoma belcheri]|nr:hypothetical protein Bbelb_412570 [Branchiostoma belcheri]